MKMIVLLLIGALLVTQPTLAAPGAHGPNGEHLDVPGAGSMMADSTPRTETFTENFELVARLYSTELSVLIDDYNTNTPVLNATLELELNGLKSTAVFHEDAGDYAFNEPALLELLNNPGDHELVFTLTTPTKNDLLLATLETSGAATEHVEHGHPHHDDHERHGHWQIDELLHSPHAWLALALVLGLLALIVWRIRSRAMIQLFIPAILVAAAATLSSSPSLAAPGAHGPNGEHLDEPANHTPGGLARLPDGSVNVPKMAQRRMEIRTQMVFQGEHIQTTELNGKVDIDPNAGGRVQAPFQGRVEPPVKGFPALGQTVRKGEVLAYLHPLADAISVGSQRAELAEVKANLTLAQQRLERLNALQGSVPKKELEAAQAELSALQGRERALNNSVAGRQTLIAPASGVIAKSEALNGQVVEPSHVLFEVIDPRRLLIEANTANAGLAQQVQGGSLAGIEGVELTLLGTGRSLVNGAIPITFRANAAQGNSSLPLAVGQPVTVLARLNTKAKGIVLPSEAVVRNPNNEAIVWIKAGAERFIAQPVQYKALNAREVLITNGLAEENRVVVSGTNLINQIR